MMKPYCLKKPKIWPLCFLVVFLVLTILVYVFQLKINLTESIRVGVYAKSFGAIHRGDLVALCLLDKDKQLGLAHHYLIPGMQCNGSMPLLKQVIAVPGDHVQLTADFIEVNGKRYVYVTELKDHLGQILNSYPKGDYLDSQGYWLVGNHSLHSWDSRYWGPLPRSQILYKIRPLLTFEK